MIKLLIVALVTMNLHAQIMGTAFEQGTSSVKLNEQEAKARFSIGEPVCLKDGARVLTYNDAYKAKYKGDKMPCRKNFVGVIKLKDLDIKLQKTILGVN